MANTRKGPFRLVTVNTAPGRAKELIGRLIDGLSDSYDIDHVANCSSEPSRSLLLQLLTPTSAIDEVYTIVKQHQPNVLFSASMWTPEEAVRIAALAESARPGIKTHAIPQGLQVERGPDAIVEYLLATMPGLLDTVEEI